MILAGWSCLLTVMFLCTGYYTATHKPSQRKQEHLRDEPNLQPDYFPFYFRVVLQNKKKKKGKEKEKKIWQPWTSSDLGVSIKIQAIRCYSLPAGFDGCLWNISQNKSGKILSLFKLIYKPALPFHFHLISTKTMTCFTFKCQSTVSPFIFKFRLHAVSQVNNWKC